MRTKSEEKCVLFRISHIMITCKRYCQLFSKILFRFERNIRYYLLQKCFSFSYLLYARCDYRFFRNIREIKFHKQKIFNALRHNIIRTNAITYQHNFICILRRNQNQAYHGFRISRICYASSLHSRRYFARKIDRIRKIRREQHTLTYINFMLFKQTEKKNVVPDASRHPTMTALVYYSFGTAAASNVCNHAVERL